MPPLKLPETDIFSFVFDRQNRTFPDNHSMYSTLAKVNQIVISYLFRLAELFQNAETNEAYTYAEIKQSALGFGAGLKSKLKWQKGDVLAMFAGNSIEWPAVVLGALWVGGVVSPANPGYTAKEFSQQLSDNSARAIVTQHHLLGTVKEALALAGMTGTTVILIDQLEKSTAQIPHFTNIYNSGPKFLYSGENINPKTDLAFLVYSSGTTGKPKGVKLSHYNVTSNISQLQPGDQEYLTWNGSKTCSGIPLPKDGADRIIASVPFFHIYGLTKTIINSLYTGATTVVLTKFDVENWCKTVQEQSITFSYIVPPIVLLLCKHPAVSKYDLSSIRMANSGAATLSPELINACYKRTGIRLKQGYGMTETCPTVFNQTWDRWDQPLGSTGQLLPNVEAKICDLSDESMDPSAGLSTEPRILQQGETGELYVRGPNVFLGYHNNAAATKASLSPDGWYRTGDVGFVDKQGNLFITDRVKELIKYKGFQVAPAELEGYLLENPQIADCAVVGVRSDEAGTELPRAYVVRKDSIKSQGTADDGKAILQWFNSRVANHKRLRGGIVFVEEIPRSTSGKTLRKVLKEWVQRGRNASDMKVRAKL
jgi:acyl-CoA synthetase (AMP-forming)/AMP-acid ligase II